MATAVAHIPSLRASDDDVVVAILPLPSARRTLVALALTAAALCGLSLLNLALGQTSPLLRLFDSGMEANASTWLSSATWAAAGACACAIGVAARRVGDAAGGRWLLLGCCFVLLSVDETAQMHELTVGPLVDVVERLTGLAHGPARLAAAASVGVLLLMLAAWMWPWMRSLPRDLRARLLLAGVVFVGGSLGLEVLSRLLETPYLSPFEELTEMLGTALLLTALLPCARAVIARAPSRAS